MDTDGPLAARLDELATRAATDRSPARARQLRWVAGELGRFAALQGSPVPLPALLAAPLAARYLQAAAAGDLRVRATARPPSSTASTRVRLDCLALLAQAAGVPVPELDAQEPAPLVPRLPATAARTAGAALGGTRAPLPVHLRHALVLGIVADTGLRVGELAALHVSDLDLGARTLTYTPRPPAGRRVQPARTVPLSAATTRAALTWLATRAQLTALTPRVTSLLVSVHGNHDGDGRRRPPGLPLQPRGLARAHRRAVAQLNASGATTELLPARLGPLRPAES